MRANRNLVSAVFVIAMTAAFDVTIAGTHAAQGRGGAAGAAVVAGAAAQAPLVRTASIAGQVVDADTGAPVPGAIVRMQSRALAAAGPNGGRGGNAAPLIMPGAPATPGTETVIADRDGRFAFDRLPKGGTQLSATAAGYLDRAPSGAPQRPIQLQDDQRLTGVQVKLLRAASVTGQIVDEAGEPVVGIAVRAMRRESPQGVPRNVMSGGSQLTDDRGMYRIDGLPPGQVFIVVPQSQTIVPASDLDRASPEMSMVAPMMEALTGGAQGSIVPASIRVGDQAVRSSQLGPASSLAPPPPQNGRFAAYQTTFYPTASHWSQAAPLTLRSGEERTGVDIAIRPTAIAKVSGVLQGPTGPVAGQMVRLVPAPGGGDDDAMAVGTATTAADGSFAFLGVPSGQFVAKAQRTSGPSLAGMPPEVMANIPAETLALMQSRSGAGESLFAQAPVSVGDRDVAGLTLVLRPGAKISGKLVFDGTAALTPQQIQGLQVQFIAFSRGTATAKVDAERNFKSASNVGPGLYTIGLSGNIGSWMMKSATTNGRDVLTTGFTVDDDDIADLTITLTDRPASVTGTVHIDGNGALPNTSVLLVSADYRAQLAAGVAPKQSLLAVQPSGAFTAGRLVAGDYFALAIPDDLVPIDRDAAFFAAVERYGVRVTVGDGETKSQDFKLVRSIR